MLNVAFWNVHKELTTRPLIAQLAVDLENSNDHDATDTVLCIAEPGDIHPRDLLQDLASIYSAAPGSWWTEYSFARRFICMSNIDRNLMDMHNERVGCLPITLTRPNGPSGLTRLNLWFVHLASSMGIWTPDSHQTSEGTALAMAISRYEAKAMASDTVAIGDFNMPPYSPGMVSKRALVALSCRHEALDTSMRRASNRSVEVDDDADEFDLAWRDRTPFYNPMWRFLGDYESTNQPGTYYGRNESNANAWHMLDQVLLRPSLISRTPGLPEIVRRIGSRDLIRNDRIIDKTISDHLPVYVSLQV